MKKKLLYFLLHPFVLAGIISAIIILFLPDYFSKYTVKQESSERLNGEGAVVFYSDLDGDNKSEKIRTQINRMGNASYLIHKSNGDFIDQFNLEGEFSNRFKLAWFQDGNRDGLKEIYSVLRSGDSLHLNVLELKDSIDFSVRSVFVDTIASVEGDYDFGYLNYFEGFDRQNPPLHEVIFAVSSGFSCYPRNAYRYNYNNNSVSSSPYLTNPTDCRYSADLDSDGSLEFLTNVSSPGNDNVLKYSDKTDYSNWVTVLDDDLNYFFEPLEIKARGGTILIPDSQNEPEFLIGMFNSLEYGKVSDKLFKLNLKGQIIKESPLPNSNYVGLFRYHGDKFLSYAQESGKVLIFDSDLEILETVDVLPQLSISPIDINFDEEEEWVGTNSDRTLSVIWDSNFEHPIIFELPGENIKPVSSGIRFLGENNIQLYFQKGNNIDYFSYSENPFYYLKYMFYVGIYLTVLLLIWLILKGQKLREAKKRALELEISELQLKTIKNQVDPHFVFNAINTISEMTLMDNKLEADRFICEFSDLMRKTLNRSDKITISLQDELAYVQNYLRLQQIRHKNSFDFWVEMGKEVNPEQTIPKHAIYTFVENALKYGLPKKRQGKITVKVLMENENLILLIEDNGEGISKDSEKKHSTGSGLKIIQQIFELYSKRFGNKIEYSLRNKNDENSVVSGTVVEVVMRLKKGD